MSAVEGSSSPGSSPLHLSEALPGERRAPPMRKQSLSDRQLLILAARSSPSAAEVLMKLPSPDCQETTPDSVEGLAVMLQQMHAAMPADDPEDADGLRRQMSDRLATLADEGVLADQRSSPLDFPCVHAPAPLVAPKLTSSSQHVYRPVPLAVASSDPLPASERPRAPMGMGVDATDAMLPQELASLPYLMRSMPSDSSARTRSRQRRGSISLGSACPTTLESSFEKAIKSMWRWINVSQERQAHDGRRRHSTEDSSSKDAKLERSKLRRSQSDNAVSKYLE